jgi:hypothetical protein
MPSPSPAAALAAARELGPFFAVDPFPTAVAPGWDSFPPLVADPAALRRRVATTAALLAAAPGGDRIEVDEWVAASLTSLGLAARFVSPVLGAALLTGVLPVVRPPCWLVGPPRSGPVEMAARVDDGLPWATPDDLADAVVRHCLEPVVLPLIAAFRAAFGLPSSILTGNAASAVAGAVQMVAARRPDLAQSAMTTLAVLLREGPLAGAGEWAPAGPRPFTRRSCCLLYRLPGAEPCGDCVLHLAPARRSHAG